MDPTQHLAQISTLSNLFSFLSITTVCSSLLFPISAPVVQDDESLKYLTHEEKDVILFFEETIDSLEDDFEEQVLCDGHSPGSLEECASGHSEPGEVIDLVQPAPEVGEPEGLPAGTATAGEDVPCVWPERRWWGLIGFLQGRSMVLLVGVSSQADAFVAY